MRYRHNEYKNKFHNRDWEEFEKRLDGFETRIKKFGIYSGKEFIAPQKYKHTAIAFLDEAISAQRRTKINRDGGSKELASSFEVLPAKNDIVELIDASPIPERPSVKGPPDDLMLPKSEYPVWYFGDTSDGSFTSLNDPDLTMPDIE